MAYKQEYLKSLCLEEFKEGKHEKLKIQDLIKHELIEEANKIYKELDGQKDNFPIKYGPWDIELENFIIEFDEESHFNRFRLQTLNSKIYKSYFNFNVDEYKNHCINYETKCLKKSSWGKYWKSKTSEEQFGISSIDLNGIGSSRWKQRAYYDFLKDITSICLNKPIIRISIYDKVGNSNIENLINTKNKEALVMYIKSMLNKP